MLRRLATVTAIVVTLGTSYLAGSASATVDPTHPLPVPSAPSVSVSGEAAHISWSGVDSAAVTGYRAQIAVGAPGVVTTTPHWFDAGTTDGSTFSLTVDDLRSSSVGCPTGACSVVARVESLDSQGFESGFSAASAPAALPLPFTIPMSVARHDAPGRIVLTLWGASSNPGQVIHLLKLDRDKIWQDTGRTTIVRLQRVPGHRHAIEAWQFKIIVRTHGKSNFRVEIPAAGQFGEGTSRPYGVRL